MNFLPCQEKKLARRRRRKSRTGVQIPLYTLELFGVMNVRTKPAFLISEVQTALQRRCCYEPGWRNHFLPPGASQALQLCREEDEFEVQSAQPSDWFPHLIVVTSQGVMNMKQNVYSTVRTSPTPGGSKATPFMCNLLDLQYCVPYFPAIKYASFHQNTNPVRRFTGQS